MEDFSENKETVENEFENSTVFSDPAQHRSILMKPKRKWPKFLVAVLALAVLISGTFAVIKLIPEISKDENSPYAEEISVLSLKSDDVLSLTVKNENGTVKLYSKEEKSQSGDTTITDWYVENLDGDKTSELKIEEIANAVSVINASREVTKKSTQECGLDNPAIEVAVTPKSGDEFTVLIGDRSPDKSGYYLKLSTADNIYVVGDELKETLSFHVLDLANDDIIPAFKNSGGLDDYFNSDVLFAFDKIIINGKDYKKAIEIIKNTDEKVSQYIGYIMTSPSKRIADNVDPIIELFGNGIEVEGAYSYDVSAKSLAEFGLNSPDLEIKMVIKDKSLTYKFKAQDDSGYAVIYDGANLIKKINSSSLDGIIGLSETDYYSSWVCYNMIKNLSNFTVKTEDTVYSFDIKSAEKDDGSEEYTITHNGKTLTAINFQYF